MDPCFRHKNAEFVQILTFLSTTYRKKYSHIGTYAIEEG